MITDIIAFLNNKISYQTNQVIISYEALFKGYIVKNWVEADINNKYEDYNKIIVYECVKYYSICWEQRCTIAQNEDIQLMRYREWHKKEWEEARNNAHPQIRNYARVNDANEENMTKEELKKRILRLKYFYKGVKP